MASCVNSEIVCVTVFVSHQVYFLYISQRVEHVYKV